MSAVRIEPTPERLRKGGLEKPEDGVVVTDDSGHAVERASPYRNVDLLARLLRRDAITDKMHAAGSMFREVFRRACLEALHCSDWMREVGAGRPADASAEALQCRRRVLATMDYLGGATSLRGSVLWSVVGLEQTLRDWSREHQRNPQEGLGILVASLEGLAQYYRL
jgi:uncharacterized protein DUF6456